MFGLTVGSKPYEVLMYLRELYGDGSEHKTEDLVMKIHEKFGFTKQTAQCRLYLVLKALKNSGTAKVERKRGRRGAVKIEFLEEDTLDSGDVGDGADDSNTRESAVD